MTRISRDETIEVVKRIGNFFKAIGSFLNLSEEYLDERVRTGLFITDLRYLIKKCKELLEKRKKYITFKLVHSSQFLQLEKILKTIWKYLMHMSFFAYTYLILFEMVRLCIKYYAAIFLTFAATFPTLILLMNFFDSNIVVFFIALPFIILWNIYAISALFLCLQKNEKSEKIHLGTCYALVLKQLPPLSFISFTQLSLFIEVAVLYIITVLFFGYFFDAIGYPWGDSFLYWFVVSFIGLIFLIGLFIATLLLHQTFFFSLLDGKKSDEAFSFAIYATKTYAAPILFFHLLIFILSITLTYWASLYYAYIGFALGIYFSLHISVFLGFLLRRKFFYTVSSPNTIYATKPTFVILIIFGIVNYALGSYMVINQFNYLTGIIDRQRSNYFLAKELVTYTNDVYHFTIQYPQNWTEYEWRGNSVTFYNNYTGTVTGGIWLNISVSPFDESEFTKLHAARPGLVTLNNTTQDLTTKVSDIAIQGNPGVNYTYYKSQEPYPEYQTHYIIHKDRYLYRIIFTTIDKDVEGNNTDLYEKIISTFRFTD